MFTLHTTCRQGVTTVSTESWTPCQLHATYEISKPVPPAGELKFEARGGRFNKTK